MKNSENFNYNYIPDYSLNLEEAEKNLICKCLGDFSAMNLEFIANKLGISERQLVRKMREMKIVRRYKNNNYEIYD